ncbi:hypothetical protein DFH06DRAFT_1479489 [Mycena polygramma]|nr:hypothetical protein DFH06DRAFT_1479489 [Mycena polygramma]
MHPAVQMKNLGRLPLSIRVSDFGGRFIGISTEKKIQRVAIGACGSNRSLKDLENVKDWMDAPNTSEAQRSLLLPVFFANLDPEEIPTSEQLEVFSPHTEDTIARAVSALETIYSINMSKAVGADIWPRVWPWYNFINAHWDHLPGIELMPALIFHTDFLLFIGAFHDDPPSTALMLSTLGFRAMLVKVWSLLPDVDEPKRLEMTLNDLCGFIADCGARDRTNLEEMVEAAGGSLENLASLVTEFVTAVIRRESPVLPNSIVYYIGDICSFIADADLFPAMEKQELGVPLGPLSTLLPLHKFVEALVDAINSVSKISAAETGDTLDQCFLLLDRILASSVGHMWLEEALEQGLLRAIVTCSTLGCAVQINHYLRYLLDHIIPNGLIHYYIVLQAKISLPEVTELASADSFRNCPVFVHWQRLTLLVEERVRRVEQFHSIDYHCSRACDNVECGWISDKGYFQRCSGCKAFYYCSAECQIADWKDGHHREACSSYGYLTLTELTKPKLLVRERDFLRSLVHHDYEQNLPEICLKQVKFMRENPRCTLFVTVFNYTKGSVEIEVQDASDQVALADVGGLEWHDLKARATRSDGLLQLHAVRVYRGTYIRYWVIPLRTNGLDILEQLSPPVLPAKSTEEATLARIDSFCESDPDRTEIH